MILTHCAACAAPLGLALGKKCGRCSTRYCGPACQEQHWKEGGHDQLCKKIKKQGGAEQYNANKKCSEAVAAAAEKCTDDTKGQTCYICTQAIHWKTKEGLVRMCSCRGTAGFAHVSCLAEQAKLLFAEAEENKLDVDVLSERWKRWHTCSLCEQQHHGVVRCALGWACWKTYVGRPETNKARGLAMGVLANGLCDADHFEDALSVYEAELSMRRRLGSSEYNILVLQGNLSNLYARIGRLEHALLIRRDVYAGFLKLFGEEHYDTLTITSNFANLLVDLDHYEEAKVLLRKKIPVARRVFGDSIDVTLKLRRAYAMALRMDPRATLDDVREAVAMLEDLERVVRRVFGGAHPFVAAFEESLQNAREALRARETPSGSA